jgi:hypothetical protein
MCLIIRLMLCTNQTKLICLALYMQNYRCIPLIRLYSTPYYDVESVVMSGHHNILEIFYASFTTNISNKQAHICQRTLMNLEHIYHIDNDSFLYLDRLITRISLRISALFSRLIIILQGTRGIQIVHTLCAEWRPLIFRDESNTQLA